MAKYIKDKAICSPKIYTRFKKKKKKPWRPKNREARPTALQPISVITGRVVLRHDCTCNANSVIAVISVNPTNTNSSLLDLVSFSKHIVNSHGYKSRNADFSRDNLLCLFYTIIWRRNKLTVCVNFGVATYIFHLNVA